MCATIAGVATAACSSSQSRPRTWIADPRRIPVTVRNDNWLDADVYVFRFGSRFRIGVAPGLETTVLRLPQNLIHDGTVRLLIDPVGSPATYTSDQIVVGPGQRIEFTVRANITMSDYAVWNQ